MKSVVARIYASDKTVFKTRELGMLLNESQPEKTRAKIHYYVKQGYLISLRRGIYAKNSTYSRFELGNKISTPSYISLDTVLRQNGNIYQFDTRIFLVSYLSREISIRGQGFVYQKIKDKILTCLDGVEYRDNYFIASPERAFLDKIYLNPNFYFDNLDSIDWEKAFTLAKIYQSRALLNNLHVYYENAR